MTTTKQKVDYAHPGAKLVLPVDPSREDWLKARFKGVGGSDVATIMGFNKYEHPFGLWLSKIGQSAKEEPSEAMWWGHNTEALTVQRFEEITGLETRRVGTLQSHGNERHLVNIDRLVSDGGILEVKDHETLSDAGKQVQKGEITEHAYAQLQWGMHVSGRSHGWFVAKVGKEAHVLGPFSRDEAFIVDAIAAADAFWAHVEAGTPPPVDLATVTDEELKARFATIEPNAKAEASIPEIVWDDLAELERVKAEQAELKAARELLETRLKAQIGEKEFLAVDGKPVARWQSITANRLDTAALRKAHPAIAAEFMTTSTYRKFSILGGK